MLRAWRLWHLHMHFYRHLSKPKGHALIINNRVFHCRLPERFGTDTDCRNMRSLLEGLGYVVQVHNNLKGKTMIRFSQKPELRKSDSAAVVLLSHGEDGRIYGVDGSLLSVQHIISYLDNDRCLALINKPKLFFIQACRGGMNFFLNVSVAHRTETVLFQFDCIAFEERDSSGKLPRRSDMLIAYATLPGFVSWRNSLHGSWFIQSICQIFAQYACEEDILNLLTRVMRFSKIGSYLFSPEMTLWCLSKRNTDYLYCLRCSSCSERP
ncbi:unnamed protein product [Soboliphyme baturini]|uniref:CASPASE_P20 domain-containing protein n=1 Tax=Soboliphyme baturini TaxID=241478 RepID=A0A183J1X1_9BILA|nr:unnamed protein product [Soboliphyme baturini]